MNQFLTLTTAQSQSSEASTPQSLRMIDSVISVIFDGGLQAEAQADVAKTWCSRIVDVALNGETQSAFNAHIGVSLSAINGQALVRMSAEGKSICREIRADAAPKNHNKPLRLRIAPSATPRSFIRIHLWVEAQTFTQNGEALATIDNFDLGVV